MDSGKFQWQFYVEKAQESTDSKDGEVGSTDYQLRLVFRDLIMTLNGIILNHLFA